MVQINNWLVDTVFAKSEEAPTLDTLMVVVDTSRPFVEVTSIVFDGNGESYRPKR